MASDRAAKLRGLYAITPATTDTALLVAKVEAALMGGAAVLQYRAKDLARELALDQARRLALMCRDHGVPLIVNDSVELAIAAGADGVHLGRDDGDPAAARREMKRGIIGVSCYADVDRARDAAAAGADYVAIGSVFPSWTKPAAVRAPLDLITRAKQASRLPVVAIGGITPHNAREAIAAGADMVASISAIFESRHIVEAAAAFAHLFTPPDPGKADARAQPRPL